MELFQKFIMVGTDFPKLTVFVFEYVIRMERPFKIGTVLWYFRS